MDREQSIALWQQGKEAWNAWANKMLAQREELEKVGDDRSDWLAEARVDFSSRQFAPPVDTSFTGFEDFIFPWAVMFVDTQFQGEARFSGARFRGPAGFLGTQFRGKTSFSGAQFHGPAGFLEAQFHCEVCFSDASFQEWDQFLQRLIRWKKYPQFRGATFNKVVFQGDAYFNGVYFKETVSFQRTKFLGLVEFRGTEFYGNTFFRNAKFEDCVSFESAVFGTRKGRCIVDFTSITASQPFALLGAKFYEVPAFNQADIKQLPDLGIDFPLPSFWGGGEEDLVSRYRHIRRLAKDHDHETEQKASRGELRSRRWTTDKPWHPALLLGILYDGVSQCGRSILRPAGLWALSVLAFAVLYVRMTDGAWTCRTPFYKALYLSGRNALVLSSGGKDDRITQAYRCLFGPTDISLPLNIQDAVSFVESFAQVPLSALLIFLVLLAIRNKFKIK